MFNKKMIAVFALISLVSSQSNGELRKHGTARNKIKIQLQATAEAHSAAQAALTEAQARLKEANDRADHEIAKAMEDLDAAKALVAKTSQSSAATLQ